MTANAVGSSEVPPGLPADDLAFHLEQHGIDYIATTERWATPRAIAGLWAGASVNIEYLVYGAILMTFGFTFVQALVVIVAGNLSWLLVGLTSLQGPQCGTTAFSINRAPFGPRGSKALACCNWLTMLGFEVEGLILIVGAALVLLSKGGIHESTGLKSVLIVVAVAIQAVLPYLGHATMTRVLRLLIVPFVIIYVALTGFAVGHAHVSTALTGVTWQDWTAGLAFAIALSGLGWTENGNDYSRYLPADVSARATVGWLFVGTALPEIALMSLGAAVYSFVGTAASWNAKNPFGGLLDQHAMPGWFVVVFLMLVVVQLFGINSLDLYSSGVTLQAMGFRIKRYHAVLLDSVICLALTFYAVFDASFSTLLKDFVEIIIVWIAPWCGIFLVDWLLRGRRYDPTGLQRTGPSSPYWATSGVNWAAIVAQVVGGIASLSALNAAFLPTWCNPITIHTGGHFYGADFSIYLGLGVGALCYLALGRSTVATQRATLRLDAVTSP